MFLFQGASSCVFLSPLSSGAAFAGTEYVDGQELAVSFDFSFMPFVITIPLHNGSGNMP
jgi:hypothetical protein